MSTEIEELMQAGIAAYQSGDLEHASRVFRLVLETEPSNPDAHHNLGVVLSAYGNTKPPALCLVPPSRATLQYHSIG